MDSSSDFISVGGPIKGFYAVGNDSYGPIVQFGFRVIDPCLGESDLLPLEIEVNRHETLTFKGAHTLQKELEQLASRGYEADRLQNEEAAVKSKVRELH